MNFACPTRIFWGGRKEKSLALVQTSRVERTFSARSVQVHTHLCRGSLPSGCRARWPVRHAESAAPRYRDLRLRGALSTAAPVRQRPPGTQPLPFFNRGSLFNPAVWTPCTENETAPEKNPQTQPQPQTCSSGERGGTCLPLRTPQELREVLPPSKKQLKILLQPVTLHAILSGSQWTRQVWQKPGAATGPYSGFLAFPIFFFFTRHVLKFTIPNQN